LMRLKAGKANDSFEDVAPAARDVQLQLLALRRTHRAMAKVTDAGRTLEMNMRRLTDVEHAHLETRRYESGCSRVAARSCRGFPTPQLSKLRPLLNFPEGTDEESSDVDASDGAPDGASLMRSAIAVSLEAEHSARAQLEGELEALEAQRAQSLQALREREEFSSELASRLRNVERALEPVIDLLELRPKQDRIPGAPPLPDEAGAMAQLSTPLRLIFSKFDALAATGAEGGSVTAHIESVSSFDCDRGEQPQEKRARREGSTSRSATVRVDIDATEGGEMVRLYFTNPQPSVITVACKDESLISGLWQDDDGRALAAALTAPTTGQPYYWAQVLAGLRQRCPMVLQTLVQMEAVSATDVVQRVRARLKAQN